MKSLVESNFIFLVEKDEYRMASESVTQLTVDAIKLREGNHVYDLSKTKASKLINSLIRNVEAVQKFSLDSVSSY